MRKMINDRAPFGVVEVSPGGLIVTLPSAVIVLPTLARALPPTCPCWGSVVMGTRRSPRAGPVAFFGGVIAARPAAAYPDERYRTKMIWWDRRTLANHAQANNCQNACRVAQLLRDVEALSATCSDRWNIEPSGGSTSILVLRDDDHDDV